MKQRIAQNIDKFTIDSLIADWINEKRDEIAEIAVSLKYPLKFLLTTKTINLTTSYSYLFDKGEDTGRYGGAHSGIKYYNGTTTVDLSFADYELFQNLFPSQEAGDPTVYTVKGENLVVNKIPAIVTSKTFTPEYFALPDILKFDNSEEYIDKKYYSTIIAFVCAEALDYLIEDGQKIAYWNNKAIRGLESIIMKDSGVDLRTLREKMNPQFDAGK